MIQGGAKGAQHLSARCNRHLADLVQGSGGEQGDGAVLGAVAVLHVQGFPRAAVFVLGDAEGVLGWVGQVSTCPSGREWLRRCCASPSRRARPMVALARYPLPNTPASAFTFNSLATGPLTTMRGAAPHQ